MKYLPIIAGSVFLSNCCLFPGIKKKEPEIIIIELPEKEEKQSTYKEKIDLVRAYFATDQLIIKNYEVGEKLISIAQPKQELFGKTNLLFIEIYDNKKSIAYVHYPNEENPNTALEGKKGILENLLSVYESGKSLELHIVWNYTVHRPPNKELLDKYEQTIDDLVNLIK